MSEAALHIAVDDNRGIIVGQNHGGYVVGRDLYVGDQYVSQETLYFEPNLRDVEPPAWATTPKARELAAAVFVQNLIILAGQDLDDKTMVARHLAWLLRKQLQPKNVVVREWYRSSDPQKIETAFHNDATTILLLPQILPHHVGYRVTELRRLLRNRQNYAVITTDGAQADWSIQSGSSDEHFWKEISWETYYGRPFLTSILLEELTSGGGRLPEGLPRDPQASSLLAEGLTVEEAAARLKQPKQIRQFSQWLRSKGASSPRDLLSRLDELGGDREAILHWYQQLGRADQLLALGLVVFDGLPDDQIFAALEYLVNEAWRKTDPNLPLFDYSDFERLGTHFHLAETGQDGTRIETTSRQKREAIFNAAWKRQRRRLLTIVPAMTRLIKEIAPATAQPAEEEAQVKPTWLGRLAQAVGSSKAEKPHGTWRFTQGPERELFSSPRRVEQLQRSVIEALSQIGLLSFEAVEASFLDLAVDGTAGFQTIVAKALAAWRGDGHSEQLFRVLNGWWEDGCRATLPDSLQERTFRKGVNPLVQMRATVASAVAYALQYDPPNQLAPELFSLLQLLVQDRHPIIRQRVLELTLPLAVAAHLRQLAPLLRTQLILDQEQMYATAFGAAMAYSLRPAEVEGVLGQWHVQVRSQGPRGTALAVTDRDRLLATVALAYGYIRCDEVQDLLTPGEVISTLRSILAVESHPYVRTHVLMAMGLQAVHSFELAGPTLLQLISEITLPDRLHVVSVFVRAYLYQRERLTGGDEATEVAGRSFQIWTRSTRPLTAVEQSLCSWLQDKSHPVAQQIAVQTFAAISATPLEKRERSFVRRRTPALGPVGEKASVLVAPQRLRDLSPVGRLAVFLSAPRRKEIRRLLSPVLAEVIDLRRSDRSDHFYDAVATSASQSSRNAPSEPVTVSRSLTEVVLRRWQVAPDQGLQNLSRPLGVALDIFRWRWPIILAFIASCGLLYYDVTDWWDGFAAPVNADAEWAIQQRRAAPLKLAWHLWAPELRQREEIRRREDLRQREEEEKLAARRLSLQDSIRLASMDQPILPSIPAVLKNNDKAEVSDAGSKEPEVYGLSFGKPVEHLVRNAELVLLKGPRDEEGRWLLRVLPLLQRKIVRQLKSQDPDGAQEPVPSFQQRQTAIKPPQVVSPPARPQPQIPAPARPQPQVSSPTQAELPEKEQNQEVTPAQPAESHDALPSPPEDKSVFGRIKRFGQKADKIFPGMRPTVHPGPPTRPNQPPKLSTGDHHDQRRTRSGEVRPNPSPDQHQHAPKQRDHRGREHGHS